MSKKLPKGSIVALITPFREDGTVNTDKIRELVEFHIANKTDGILVLGTTGETPTMTAQEDELVAKTAIEQAAGRIPIIVGSGSNNTDYMLQKSRLYEQMGADGLLLISPYYNKANHAGLIRHFETVADAVNIPCILYNIPGRTGVSIPVDVVEHLSKHPNIQAIKEASGNIGYAMQIAPLLNENFQMYSGNDDQILPLLAIGGDGVISVWANLEPEKVHTLVQSFHDGDLETSRKLQLEGLDLVGSLFCEVNPIPVKTAMNILGKECGGLRLPLCEMDEANKARLEASLKKAGLLA